MANQVIVPFRRTSPRRANPRALLGRFDPETPVRRRSWVTNRMATLGEAVRAVMETLAYLSEPRVSPPFQEPKRLTAGGKTPSAESLSNRPSKLRR